MLNKQGEAFRYSRQNRLSKAWTTDQETKHDQKQEISHTKHEDKIGLFLNTA